VAAVQYTFTHKQYTEYTEYTERNIHNKKKTFGTCRPYPVFASYTLAFALQPREKHGKPSVRVVEKYPDIPVAVVQYTFTHKQHTQHCSTLHIYTQHTEHRSTQHIYTQTAHTTQQYSTHLHTNSTHNTAVHYTFTHKQHTQHSSTVHIYTQTAHTT
jgi:hypothetical protein